MTKKVFYLIDEDVTPDVYKKVIEVKKILSSGEVNQITEAVKIAGISRGAFYKYKDHIFLSNEQTMGNIATFALFLSHVRGVLSVVLNKLADLGVNVITINQNIPINDIASVTISVDIKDLQISLDECMKNIKEINGVCSIDIIAVS